MNIDLLVTQQGDAGLVCDFMFTSPLAGIIYDAQTHQLSFEYSDMDVLELNIPVQDDLSETMLMIPSLQVGVIEHGQIQLSRQVPLLLLNDPLGGGLNMPKAASNSVTAFEAFLRNCISGQPVHRENLDADIGADASASVIGGINRAVLDFAPHLQRQKSLEARHGYQPTGPAPSTPGMGGGPAGGGGTYKPPPRRTDDDDTQY